MDQLVTYLEKLGYTVEEQGKMAKYLVVIRDGLPLGFILADMTVRLISGAEEQHALEQIVSFVRQNELLPLVGGSEYLVARYRGHQLTTYFDVQSACPKYCVYLCGENGVTSTVSFADSDSAMKAFVSRSGMLDLSTLYGQRVSFMERIQRRLLNYLLKKVGGSTAIQA